MKEHWKGSIHVLGIGRYYRGEQLLALLNFSGRPRKAVLRDDKTYTDLISGKDLAADTVTLGAGSFRWLLHKF